MSTNPNTTTVFTPEQIAQAAKGNVLGLCLVAVAYVKAHGLSPDEYWAYVWRSVRCRLETKTVCTGSRARRSPQHGLGRMRPALIVWR